MSPQSAIPAKMDNPTTPSTSSALANCSSSLAIEAGHALFRGLVHRAMFLVYRYTSSQFTGSRRRIRAGRTRQTISLR